MICVIPVVVVVVRVDSAVAGASVVDFAAADQGAAALTTEEDKVILFCLVDLTVSQQVSDHDAILYNSKHISYQYK